MERHGGRGEFHLLGMAYVDLHQAGDDRRNVGENDGSTLVFFDRAR